MERSARRGTAKPVLRVLGTAVTLTEDLRRQAEADLGIAIEYQILDGVEAQQRAATQPSRYDIYDQWFHNIEIVWSSGAIQPIRASRIDAWDQVVRQDPAVAAAGRRHRRSQAPVMRLYVQADKRLGPDPADFISALPTVYNMDSFGYLPDAVDPALVGGPESWGWLLDNRFRGRAGMVADPTIGAVEAALAVEALDLARFEDIGDLTIDEIDTLTGILIRKKKAGHFRALWNTVEDATALMARGDVVIESMWMPTLAHLWSRGIPARYAAPVEGYRGWHGCLALSSHVHGPVLDLAYAYLNWWMSGWAGAVMARQGYYFSVPAQARRFLTPAEWAYWYLGEPATAALCDPRGGIAVPEGAVRSGGSYADRVAQIAVWVTTMDEHNHLVRRWTQFLNA